MDKLIKSITKDSFIKVNGIVYKPIAKVFYTTQSNPETEYVKVFMEGHFALVISPKDDFMYFGKDEGCVSESFPTPDVLFYDNKEYKKTAEDYQIVKHVEFGNLLETEGEVVFIDYDGVTNPDTLLSVGLVVRTKTRADILADVIKLKDITVL